MQTLFEARGEAALAGARPVHKAPGQADAARLHVCFVAPAAWPVLSGAHDLEIVGGAEVQQCTLARAFVRHGLRVSMISLDYGQPEGSEVDGIACHKAHKPADGLPVLRFLHPRLTSIWRALARVDADIYYVRSASLLTAVVASFCRSSGRKSLYAGASDLDFLPGRQRIRYARDRWLFDYGLRRVDAVVVQNEFQRSNCRINYGRESTLVPSCYQPPAGAAADRAGDILWVSNIREVKRPELCLEIARRLPHRRFVMIGGPGGDDAASLEHFRRVQSEAASLANVRFLGFQPLEEADAWFSRARVFLNTSRHEGFPNTFLQSWSRGVPTVAFVDTGSREGTRPVYTVARQAADAAGEIERLMSDDVHWEQAADRCRRYHAAHHSVGAVTRRYQDLFSRLAGGHARQA